MFDDVDVEALARDELPAVLGRLVELEARVRLRLAEAAMPPPVVPSRILDVEEAVRIAGTGKRWLLTHTRGLKLRLDLSQKQPKFDEIGLRSWLATRRRS